MLKGKGKQRAKENIMRLAKELDVEREIKQCSKREIGRRERGGNKKARGE